MSQRETLIMIFGLVNWTVNTNEDQLSSADSSLIQLLRKIKNIKGGKIQLGTKTISEPASRLPPRQEYSWEADFFLWLEPIIVPRIKIIFPHLSFQSQLEYTSKLLYGMWLY